MAREQIGRPKKNPSDRRSKWLLIRLTPSEHQKLKTDAKKLGMTMAQLLRQAVLRQTGDGGESKERSKK
jgi:mobilization protein NikA